MSEELILPSFLFYHVLPPEQICRLFYKSGSLTFAYTLLANLARKSYLQVIKYKRAFPGRSQYLYALAGKGMKHLAHLEWEVPKRYHAQELATLNLPFLDHHLAVNDVFISLELLERADPRITVADRLHERTLKQRGTKVEFSLDSRKRVLTSSVILDGWADVRVAEPAGMVRRYCFGPEVERSLKSKRRWREKVAATIAWSRGEYQERFGTRVLTIPVFATLGDQHRDQLKRLTEETLEELGEQEEADLFRFGSVPPTVDARAIWLAPVWYRPFERQPVALLPEGSAVHA